jgi:hypothetical protein
MNVTLAQPFHEDGQIKVGLKLQVVDPLRQIQGLRVECWTGVSGKQRPACKSKPEMQPGDSELVSVQLKYDKTGYSECDLTLPILPEGKVYWVRPVLSVADGQTTWGSADPYKTSPALDRNSASLVLKGRTGIGSLHLTSTTTSKLVNDREDHEVVVDMKAELREQTVPAGPGGSLINLGYQNAQIDITLDGNATVKSDRLQQSLQGLGCVIAQTILDRNGNLKKNGVVAPRLLPALRKQVLDLHEIILATLDLVAIPLPNRKVEAGQSWTTLRPVPVVIGENSDAALMEMTCTYLGTRTHESKQVAVIGISGRLKGVAAQAQRYGGRADGLALVDAATGQIVHSTLTVHYDMDEGSARQTRAAGTILLRLERK